MTKTSTHLQLHVSRHERTNTTYINWTLAVGHVDDAGTITVKEVNGDRHELMWEDFDGVAVRARVLKALQRWIEEVNAEQPF